MKKIIVLIALTGLSYMSVAQSCANQSCDKKSCGPEGTKTEEAKAITGMRSDLQTVMNKLAKSNSGFSEQVINAEISQGSNDDESLLFIYQTAFAVHSEIVAKVSPEKLIAELKGHSLQPSANKQQLVVSLKREIKLLAEQVDKL